MTQVSVQKFSFLFISIIAYSIQGSVNMNRKQKLGKLFARMFVMVKKNKELFASTFNEITASVRCASIIVVLNAKFALLLAAHENKKYGDNRRSSTTVP